MKKTTWWRNSLTGLGVLALVSAASPAAAQRYSRDDAQGRQGYPQDQWQDRQEIGQDRSDVRDDWMDVRRLSMLMNQLDQAQNQRDGYREDRIRSRIHLQFQNEIAEARHDVARDQREVYRSNRERMRDRNGDDRNDFMVDQNNLRDSRMRFQELSRVYDRVLQIEPAARTHDWRAMRQEDRLLSRFLQLTREDAQASSRELNEDQQELREDGM